VLFVRKRQQDDSNIDLAGSSDTEAEAREAKRAERARKRAERAARRDAAEASLNLVSIPLLTKRRAIRLADCSASKLDRCGPPPVGYQGRTPVYETKAILEWMRSQRAPNAPVALGPRRAPTKALPSSVAADLERLGEIARGGSR
jgi:type II secretory pathway pseudopilin PulG